jgi:hypothetical protein
MPTSQSPDAQPGQSIGGDVSPPLPPIQPPPPTQAQSSAAEQWQTYSNPTYRFAITYPTYLVPVEASASDRAGLCPTPLASIAFQDQRLDLPALGPPAFSIRVFDNSARQNVRDWLVSQGLFEPTAGWTIEPFQGSHVTGYKVVSPTFMAPGWFVYIAQQDRILQLTPLGSDAELMLDSFNLSG